MSARLTSFLFKYLSLAVVISAAALSVAAQKPKPSPTPVPEDTQGTVTVTIRRVRLPITVTDKKGQFVPNLTKNDFVILEDKVPQTIETFSDDLSQTTPLYVAVLMDTSPSTAGKLKFQQ
ncbi:MAG TPA: hypothetical protein VFT26_01080, partial [Pyrinomonadaceae bacterium]|nr:hypothetical protein [Pyrinomonadaceae bacterium]